MRDDREVMLDVSERVVGASCFDTTSLICADLEACVVLLGDPATSVPVMALSAAVEEGEITSEPSTLPLPEDVEITELLEVLDEEEDCGPEALLDTRAVADTESEDGIVGLRDDVLSTTL